LYQFLYLSTCPYDESEIEIILKEHLEDLLTRSGTDNSGYLLPKELEVIQLHYGLTKDKKHFSLIEIADMLDMTKEEAAGIEYKAILKLRKAFELYKLKAGY